MFNSVKKVNISAANIRTNFELSKYFCGNLPFIFFLVRKMSFFERTDWGLRGNPPLHFG